MFKFVPQVEYIDHVVAVGGIGHVQHVGFVQSDHRAEVQRVVVGRGHIPGGGRRQGLRPAQLIERGTVAGGRTRVGHRGVFADHPLHAYQRITPDIRVDAIGVGVAFQPGDDAFLAGGQAQQGVGTHLGEDGSAWASAPEQ
ncbi:hypothetical protein D3C80_1570790 [compost metagenome]